MGKTPLDHADRMQISRDGLIGPNGRELAERSTNGIHVRLMWRQGTRQLWVEVREPGDAVLTIPVRPERALDAFHHPYAYADVAASTPDPVAATDHAPSS